VKYFNSREKGILEILSKIDVDNGDTFSKILSDKHFTKERGIWIIVDPQNLSVKVFYDVKNKANYDESELRKIQLEAFNTTLELRILVEYLVEQKLIYIVEIGNQNNSKQSLYSEFVGNIPKQPGELFDRLMLNQGRHDLYENEVLDINGKTVFKSFELNEFYNSIFKNWLNGVYVTEQLNKFVENGFQTNEEFRIEKKSKIGQIQFRKSQKVAWTAIGASLVIALSTQIFSHFNKKEYINKLEKHIQDETQLHRDNQLKVDSYFKVNDSIEEQFRNETDNIQMKYFKLDSSLNENSNQNAKIQKQLIKKK
jgi:hypothetical protein